MLLLLLFILSITTTTFDVNMIGVIEKNCDVGKMNNATKEMPVSSESVPFELDEVLNRLRFKHCKLI